MTGILFECVPGHSGSPLLIYVKAVLPAIAYMAGHAADSDVPISRRAILLYLRSLRPPFSFLPFFSLSFHSLAVRPMGQNFPQR